jgi:hypothetical protein
MKLTAAADRLLPALFDRVGTSLQLRGPAPTRPADYYREYMDRVMNWTTILPVVMIDGKSRKNRRQRLRLYGRRHTRTRAMGGY